MFAKRARPLVKKIYFKFRIQISNNCDCNERSLFADHSKAQNNFFLNDWKQQEMYILKKESNNFLNIPISWHFNEHARYLALYFNKSKLSIHVGNS